MLNEYQSMEIVFYDFYVAQINSMITPCDCIFEFSLNVRYARSNNLITVHSILNHFWIEAKKCRATKKDLPQTTTIKIPKSCSVYLTYRISNL